MAKQHPNAQDRMTPFLSNIGGAGMITVDTPDGVQTGDVNDLGPYAKGPSGGIRMYGARSGMAKTETVE